MQINISTYAPVHSLRLRKHRLNDNVVLVPVSNDASVVVLSHCQ